MRYAIRALDGEASRNAFDCGEPALNHYLQRFATQDV